MAGLSSFFKKILPEIKQDHAQREQWKQNEVWRFS